jgi:hypothetical protein
MSLIGASQIAAGLALAFSLLAFGRLLWIFSRLPRPQDRSAPKGSAQAGILYAFTLGMAPWAKESTRLHSRAYLRGVAFHLGIFLGLVVFLASPWLEGQPSSAKALLALGAGLGAFFGLAGFIFRLAEPNLKAISTPDDYFTVLVVSLFLACEALWLAGLLALPVFYGMAVVMLVYGPFSKIRHCLYFAASRLFFGKFVGSRAVLPHRQQGKPFKTVSRLGGWR